MIYGGLDTKSAYQSMIENNNKEFEKDKFGKRLVALGNKNYCIALTINIVQFQYLLNHL